MADEVANILAIVGGVTIAGAPPLAEPGRSEARSALRRKGRI
jgi:hypothetical protein